MIEAVVDFSFNPPDTSQLVRSDIDEIVISSPENMSLVQSMNQAFYFIEDLDINNMDIIYNMISICVI